MLMMVEALGHIHPYSIIYEMFFHYAILGCSTCAGDELYKLGKRKCFFSEKWETGAKAGRNIVRGFKT
jgi:hypothetical protein